MKEIEKTKEANINTPQYWNRLSSTHGGGERDDAERFKPMARMAWGSTLDIGTMFGHLCKYLWEDRSEPVYGVDFSRDAIQKAHRNYVFAEFLIADACHLPFRDKVFDSVTLAETLEHLTDFMEGLKEAERVGNRIVFTVPDSSVYDEHVWTFSEGGIANLMKMKGGYYEKLARKWWMGWYSVK